MDRPKWTTLRGVSTLQSSTSPTSPDRTASRASSHRGCSQVDTLGFWYKFVNFGARSYMQETLWAPYPTGNKHYGPRVKTLQSSTSPTSPDSTASRASSHSSSFVSAPSTSETCAPPFQS